MAEVERTWHEFSVLFRELGAGVGGHSYYEDELDEELQREVAAPQCDAYHVPRKSHFMGKWIRHCGWYPDYRQPQFFNRTKFSYKNDLVHESYELKGKLGYLHEHALQYPWDSIEIATAKMQRYSTLMAQRYFESGKKASILKTVTSPIAMFLKVYFFQRGFLDGRHGLTLATIYGYYTFLKYSKLWELRNKRT